MSATFTIDASVQPLLAPIPGPAPAGGEVYDEPAYALVREQIDRIGGFDGTPVDWEVVVTQGTALLLHHGKDLGLAAYTARGWSEAHPLAGTTAGLELWRGLLAGFTAATPRPATARAALLQWLIEGLERRLGQVALGAGDGPALAAIEAAARRLDAQSREALGLHAPTLDGLLAMLERLRRSLPAPASVVPLATVPQRSAPIMTSIAAAPVTAADDATEREEDGANAAEPEPEEALTRALGRLVTAAQRGRPPTDPARHRLTRAALWACVDAVDDLAVPPLPRAVRRELERLAASEVWDELLATSEDTLPDHRLQLDLQRWSAAALRGLGPAHVAARAAVDEAVVALVRRVPGLPGLHARDGSPLADAATQAWLRGLVTPAEPEVAAPQVDDEVAAAVQAADRRWAEGEGEAAVRDLGAALARRGDGRGRFLLKRAMARLLVASGHAAIGSDLYAALHRELEARRLIEWEPALTCGCVAEMLRGAAGLGHEQRERLPLRAAHETLCGADPALGLRLARELSL